ncbi:MAG: 3-dehydroquinate synthase [Ignavibacteriales bacterium]|nr:3-dehydroquinate synthase [Ignavibacteriales bacterium]
MKSIHVPVPNNAYDMLFGADVLARLPDEIERRELGDALFVAIDENVNRLHGDRVRAALDGRFRRVTYDALPAGESAKTLDQISRLYTRMLDEGFGRDMLAVAVGGGATGDSAGFAAATFMRGVNLVHVPTTVLSMVDSSIGGKTGVNFSGAKNVVGAFHQPKLVFADVRFLDTLPDDEIDAGAGEIAKYAFIADEGFFDLLIDRYDAFFRRDADFLIDALLKAAAVKAAVVAEDEKERGLRKLLNLGHTFGHAFESALDFRVKHGHAVAAGILAALALSRRLGFTTAETELRLRALPLHVRIPDEIADVDPYVALEATRLDKKNMRGKTRFVLPVDIGVTLPEVEAADDDVVEAILDMKTVLKKRQTI